MNALSAALLEELEAEVEALDADDEVRAIVLRGGGERAFVAGADIKEFPALRESAAEGGSARGIQRLGQRMDAAHTPFVAAIRGFCLGGGLELAMCCDVRVVRRRRAARPAGDQARADPRRRRHAAAAAARRHRARDVPQPDRRLRRRARPRTPGASSRRSSRVGELEDAALALAGRIASRSPHAVGGAARARADDARPPARGGAPARGGRLRPLPALRRRGRGGRRVHREAGAPLHGPLDEGRRPRRGAAARAPRGARPAARRGADAGGGACGRRQLRRRPDPRGPVPAGAAAPVRARLGDRRRDARRRAA